MKIRTGFVSNSSSSSFIMIESGDLEMKDSFKDLPWVGQTQYGCSEFGWQEEEYSDVHSKVNFAVLQAKSIQRVDWLEMIEKVIKEHTGAISVVSELSTDYDSDYYGYVDHQSASCDGENIEMFESEDRLRDFLFCPKSYIRCDNDNH